MGLPFWETRASLHPDIKIALLVQGFWVWVAEKLLRFSCDTIIEGHKILADRDLKILLGL
jgi:hypothetical protein